jgi:hypothetical protein
MTILALGLPGPFELIFLGVLAAVLFIGVISAALFVMRRSQQKPPRGFEVVGDMEGSQEKQ